MDKKILALTGAIALCAVLGVALLFWGQAGIGSGGGGNPPPKLPDGSGSGDGLPGGSDDSGSGGDTGSISDVFSGSGDVAPPPLPI